MDAAIAVECKEPAGRLIAHPERTNRGDRHRGGRLEGVGSDEDALIALAALAGDLPDLFALRIGDIEAPGVDMNFEIERRAQAIGGESRFLDKVLAPSWQRFRGRNSVIMVTPRYRPTWNKQSDSEC